MPDASATKIVFLDRATIGPGVELRPPAFAHSWEEHAATPSDKVVERLKGAAVVITNKVPLTAEHLAELPELRLVAVAATGTDVVDVAACEARGIGVVNVRGYAVTAVPEFILSVMFTLRRQLPAYARRVREGAWQDAGQFCFFNGPMADLSGQTLGIVGTGSIATALGEKAEALGMRVIFHSLSGRELSDRQMVDLDTLLESSDVVSLNCPLNNRSHQLIDKTALRLMRPQAILINTARGAIVDYHALEAALLLEEIGGAAIDVAETEPPPRDHPLMRLAHLDNVIVTPHCAWASQPAMQALADQLLDAIEAFFRGESLNRVDGSDAATS
ncbi:MAG: D-2-hydroxyacid dehydrogenase [Pseudomonadota bacterium]